MHSVYDCVQAFLPLLSTEYQLILGRKNIAVELNIVFDKKDCFHLMGLQYLKDRTDLSRSRDIIFDEILSGILCQEQFEASVHYKEIEDRIDFLPMLEEMLDSNNMIFKYNKKQNIYSMIEADYLIKNTITGRNLFLFLSKNSKDKYFCRSFFPQTKKDYSENQATWTLLYKKKINKLDSTELVLYDKLRK